MRENINKVSQRGERLDSLQDKTDNLAASAQGFRRGANRVRKQMWWKDMKMRMWLVIGIIILLVIIIVPIGKAIPSEGISAVRFYPPPQTCARPHTDDCARFFSGYEGQIKALRRRRVGLVSQAGKEGGAISRFIRFLFLSCRFSW